MERVYLDWNARAPLLGNAQRAMTEAMNTLQGNPSSQHREGQHARSAVEDARIKVAGLLNARSRDIIFTSGATESLHLAIHGALQRTPSRRKILTFATEHHAVLDEVSALKEQGWNAHILPVDANGEPLMNPFMDSLDDTCAVVSVMLANNETGVCYNIGPMVEAARKAGAFMVVDAAQVPGRVPLDVAALQADAVALSACKFGGPPGVGALWVRQGAAWSPPRHGGNQEMGRRPGTENIIGVVGMGAAAAAVDLTQMEKMRALRDAFEERLHAMAPDTVIHGALGQRLPNTTFAAFPGVDVQMLLVLLDQAGVAASSGSACVSGAFKPSHVLQAMGVNKSHIRSSVRFSLGFSTTAAEMARAAEVLEDCLPRARL